MLYPLLEAIHNLVTERIQNCKVPGFLTNAVVRVTLVLLTVVVAILVPTFSIFFSLIGSTMNCLTGYIFPFGLHLKLKYKHLKIHKICVDSVFLYF